FTRAAELSRVTQPSLSKQIRSLERELGAPLFSRVRGNITLTPAGETLLPLAQRILTDLETARREVAELAGARRGRVRLGATPSLCAGLLADVLADFHRRFPGIELQVEESGSRDLIRSLGRGELDMALIILPLQSSRLGAGACGGGRRDGRGAAFRRGRPGLGGGTEHGPEEPSRSAWDTTCPATAVAYGGPGPTWGRGTFPLCGRLSSAPERISV